MDQLPDTPVAIPAGATESLEAELDPRSASTHDSVVAVGNAFRLGGALLFTWTVAFGIRILLPRHLGPAAFGFLNFADAFTATAFVVLAFGLDTYIRKEVAVRPELGTAIFGGTLLLRGATAMVLLAAIALVMRLTHQPPIVWRLVFPFAAGQLFMAVGGTLAAVLHARGEVGGVSIVNGGGKLLWGAGILVGIALHHALVGVALAFAVSEAAKTLVLFALARRDAGLEVRLDALATKGAIVASLPFYLNQIAVTAYGRIDVTLLSFAIADERELGWYGAGSNLAGLCLLITPIIGWVLLPLLAKAESKGRAELRRTLARSMEIVLALAIPTALFMALGADLWVRVIFGSAFAPAALPLRILGATFVLTYVAVVSGTCLTVLGRGWLVTGISVAGLVLTVSLNLVLVSFAKAHFGHVVAATGAAAAVAVLLSEAFVAVVMTAFLGAMSFDRRSVGLVARTLLVSLAVVAFHRVAAPMGPIRIALDLAVYALLAFATGAVRWRELVGFIRAAIAVRREPASATRSR